MHFFCQDDGLGPISLEALILHVVCLGRTNTFARFCLFEYMEMSFSFSFSFQKLKILV